MDYHENEDETRTTLPKRIWHLIDSSGAIDPALQRSVTDNKIYTLMEFDYKYTDEGGTDTYWNYVTKIREYGVWLTHFRC